MTKEMQAGNEHRTECCRESVRVELDRESGFCPGVISAVKCAERNLQQCGTLYSLGAIVHNGSELQRLEDAGLKVIDIERMRTMHDATVLIRAHGEPPATYNLARDNNIELIDCTCPVVLKLQEKIRRIYQKGGAQILIFGKEGHAEVNGLVGQVGGDAVILDLVHEDGPDKEHSVRSIRNFNKIDWSRNLVIFSQTTKDPAEYEFVCGSVKGEHARRAQLPGAVDSEGKCVMVYDTICRQVSHRHAHLRNFAARHSVIVFVSGAESSNGKVLYELCKGVNPLSYHIQSVDQIQMEWFHTLKPKHCNAAGNGYGTETGTGESIKENSASSPSVGVCGATSTPKWQLEQVTAFLREHLN